MGLDVGEIGMPPELGLDLKLFVARSAGRMAKEAPAVDACIRSLEEERRKIEVFRRELPLCLRLLADVIEMMKEEAEKRREGGDAEDSDKTKWMSTAQLWVDSSEKEQRSESILSKPNLRDSASAPLMARALPPPSSQYFTREDKVVSPVGLPGMMLMSPAMKRPVSPVTAGDDHRRALAARFAPNMPPPGSEISSQTQQQQQQGRKTRRCWSQELHRQFVAALRQLGGPQVATPKQIREVMKVDGLTNDEVKSHLQKYRLHDQRSAGTSPANHSFLMVGDLWAHQEQSISQFDQSPHGPLQYSSSGVAVSAATVGDNCSEGDDRSEGYSRK